MQHMKSADVRLSVNNNMKERGPEIWKMIHIRALYWSNGKNDIRFINKIGRIIADVSKTCDCKYFYKRWVEENPPNFDNYFEWTVNLHNAVNKKLGKKTISSTVAKNYWKSV